MTSARTVKLPAAVGVMVALPLAVRPLAALIATPMRLRGMPGELAKQNAMRNPRRTASTAMALVIGLTMVAAVAVFAASLKSSFSDVLTSTDADLYVLTPSSQAEGFSREVLGDVRSVDGVDVAARIRTQEVTDHVSAVASVPQVRQRLLDLQRTIIGDGGIVVEGRDIASVVWPQAQVKVYLSADPGARASRRSAEEGGTDLVATEQVLRERDRIDSGRAVAPLALADGAVQIDTTAYTLNEVIGLVVGMVSTAREAPR